MKEIVTKAYGMVSIDKDEIITFKNGLPGFEDMHEFVLLSNDPPDQPLLWLQSVEEAELAFVLIKPKTFRPDYNPSFPEAELSELKLEEDREALVLAITVIPEDVKKMTANLRAPLVINRSNRLAKQIVLNDDKYTVKEPVFAK